MTTNGQKKNFFFLFDWWKNHLSLFMRQILSLLILSFFETIFLSPSTVMSLSTLKQKFPPVSSVKFKFIFCFCSWSSIFVFFFFTSPSSFELFFSLLTAAESSLEMTFEIFSQFALEILRIDRVLHRIWTRTKGSETEEMVWRREESIVATKSLFFRICGIETWRDCAKRWIRVRRCEFFFVGLDREAAGPLRCGYAPLRLTVCGNYFWRQQFFNSLLSKTFPYLIIWIIFLRILSQNGSTRQCSRRQPRHKRHEFASKS